MKKILLSFLLSLCASLVIAQNSVLKADGFIDVAEGKLIKPAVIVIENGVISAINPAQVPQNMEVIDLGGKILVPGLMDMHVHLGLDFGKNAFAIVTKESATKGSIRAVKNARKTLLAGFTTVRNVGQLHPTEELMDVALAEASDEGWIAAPRIIPSGHMISILGGHGDISMAEGLAEGILELSPEEGVISGVDEAIKATRYQIKHGAKTIKIHATAGVLSLEEAVGAQQLNNEEMVAIVEEAKRHGIPVAAHAHGKEGIKAAIRAGVSSIEHGSILDEEAINLFIENEVVLVPTTGLTDKMNLNMLDPKRKAKAEYVLPIARTSLTKAIDAGVTIALGTDAPLIEHGENAYELTAMINRGMTKKAALQAATINAATLINRKDLGQIKKGYYADIIAVAGNPLEDIQQLEEVSFVMKEGVIYKND